MFAKDFTCTWVLAFLVSETEACVDFNLSSSHCLRKVGRDDVGCRVARALAADGIHMGLLAYTLGISMGARSKESWLPIRTPKRGGCFAVGSCFSELRVEKGGTFILFVRGMESGLAALRVHAAGGTCSRRCLLQCCHQRLREGQAVAAGIASLPPHARRKPSSDDGNLLGVSREYGNKFLGIIFPYCLLTTSKVSYNSAISAVEKGGQWQLALNLFHSMSVAKLLPDVISYNATISSCDSELLNGKQSTCSMSSLGSMRQKELSDFNW